MAHIPTIAGVTDEAAFERGAVEILDACATFWDGLHASRLKLDEDIATVKSR